MQRLCSHFTKAVRKSAKSSRSQKNDKHRSEKPAPGIRNECELRDRMRDTFGVTRYAQYALSWEMFGYPDFMLKDTVNMHFALSLGPERIRLIDNEKHTPNLTSDCHSKTVNIGSVPRILNTPLCQS